MTIEMSTSYQVAVRTALPNAAIVIGHFHVVQLANISQARSAPTVLVGALRALSG